MCIRDRTLGCSYMFPEEQKQCYKMAAVYKPAGDPYSSKVAGMVSFEQSAKIKTGAHLLNLSYTGVPTKGVSIEAKCSPPSPTSPKCPASSTASGSPSARSIACVWHAASWFDGGGAGGRALAHRNENNNLTGDEEGEGSRIKR